MNMNMSADSDDIVSDGHALLAPVNLREMTPIQFAQLGLSQIAYVKPISVNGAPGFAIHAADGTPMAIASGLDSAVGAIRQHEMFPVLVH